MSNGNQAGMPPNRSYTAKLGDREIVIETGKLADFLILSGDPTAIDPERLDTLQVLTTIKEDCVVFEQTGD